MTARVLVVGAVNVDVVVSTDELPGPGQTVVGASAERYGGGKGANAAIAAARPVRRPGTTAPSAATMQDPVRWPSSHRGHRRDRCRHPRRSVDRYGLIVVDRKGENQIAVGAGANAVVGPAAVRTGRSARSWLGELCARQRWDHPWMRSSPLSRVLLPIGSPAC
jgi:ribokinase